MKLLLLVVLLVGTSLAYPVDKEEQPTVPLVITDYSSVAEAQAQTQDKPVHHHDSAESNESSESMESSEVKKPEHIKLATKSIEASLSSSEETKPNVEDKPIAEKLEKPEKEEKELKPVDEPVKVVEDNKVIEEIKAAEVPIEPTPAIKSIVPELANAEEPVKVEEPAKLEKTNVEPKVKALLEPLKPLELPAEPDKIETPLALPTIKAEEPIVPVPALLLPIANIPEKPESLPEALPSEKKIDTVIAEEKLPEVKSIEPIVPQTEIKAEEKHESIIEKRADPSPPEETRPLPKPEVVEEKKEEKLQENLTPAEPLKPEIVEDKKKAKADETPLVKEEIALVAAEPAVPIVEEKLPEPTPQVNPEIKQDEPVAVVVPEQPSVQARDVVATLSELKPEEKELKPEIKELQPEVTEQRIEEPKPVAPAAEAAPVILPAEQFNDETLVKPEEPKPEILPGATQS